MSHYLDGDIRRLAPREDMRAELEAVGWRWEDGPPPGRTWTLWHDGPSRWDAIGVGGFVDHGDGRWEAWALLGDLERRDWPEAVAFARQMIDGLIRFNGAKRIEASARADFPEAVRVLEKLGFAALSTGYDPRIGSTVPYVFMQRAA